MSSIALKEWTSNRLKNSKLSIFMEMKGKSEQQLGIEEACRQLERDIPRTFPNQKYFSKDSQGYKKVYLLLKCFSAYDKDWSYVQGMNFIASALAFHWDAKTSFCLFTSLMEEYKLRANYIQGFTGFYEHSEKILELLKKRNQQLWDFLAKNQVRS